jgi:hypothetical protein
MAADGAMQPLVPVPKQYGAGTPVWGDCMDCHLCRYANRSFPDPTNISVANHALVE